MFGTDESPAIVVGRVSGLYGVRGWCKVFSFTQPRDALLDYGGWHVRRGGVWEPVAVAEGRRHGKALLARIEGIDDREAARELVGCDIAVPRSALPDAGEGHFYWCDLEGLEVVTTGGTTIGHVREMIETGAHDVLVVDGDADTLIPFVVGKTVTDVDLAARRIVVDWEWD